MIHCDIGAWGLLDSFRDRGELLSAYGRILLSAALDRSLSFPVFNYDYGATRRFDVLGDRCQVGALNEWFRLLHPEKRTGTPMFNFIECNSALFSLIPQENPFSQKSFFGEFYRAGGRVCFMGCGFNANTFIHYAEETMNIGYRYLKPLAGVVARGGEETSVPYVFRVRPKIPGAVQYDFDRLAHDLSCRGFLDKKPLGMGEALSYNVKDVMDYWCSRIDDDEFFLLTEESKSVIDELRKTKTYPFEYEDFEL